MSSLWERISHRRAIEQDVMATLELQAQLSRMVFEVQRAERFRGFAAAHHAHAAQGAYESTLRSAVRHAGGDERSVPSGDVVALELDLAARGWQW